MTTGQRSGISPGETRGKTQAVEFSDRRRRVVVVACREPGRRRASFRSHFQNPQGVHRGRRAKRLCRLALGRGTPAPRIGVNRIVMPGLTRHPATSKAAGSGSLPLSRVENDDAWYQSINAKVQTEPPLGTFASCGPMRATFTPPTPTWMLTYCFPLCV